MAGVAFLTAGLLSRKGRARPMRTQGPGRRGSAQGRTIWHLASPACLMLTPAAPGPRRRARTARPRQDRVRVSLRLERDLHGRLKSLSASAERTQQSILVQALNEYLEQQDERLEHAGDRRCPIAG